MTASPRDERGDGSARANELALARRLVPGRAGVLVAAISVVLAACGSTRDKFAEPAGPLVSADGGASSDDACGFRCSRDLKKVLDSCGEGEGRVVADCPVGQGCGVDSCVDACTSAALSKGSTGCSFWTLPPDDELYGAGTCFAAMVANTWDVPVNISAEYGAEPLDIASSTYTVTRAGTAEAVYTPLTGPLEPGQVAVVFLAEAEHPEGPAGAGIPRCPSGVTAALRADPIRHGTAKTRAFHLKADAPVAAYSIFPYGGADGQYPAATLLLPVSSWDTSYIAVSPAKFGIGDRPERDRRSLQIVANEDDTRISMRPTVDIAAGEYVTPVVTGEAVEWSLSRGEVIQITQPRSTSGSPIVANKPVGVFGGSPCAFFPANVSYCDLTHQQIAPLSQWGTSYALVPYLSRVAAVQGTTPENVAYSFVGAVDGTELVYDPKRPPGAPERLSAGEMVGFMTDALVTVRSQDEQHPFHAAIYMTGSMSGGGVPGGAKTLGDPDFVNVVPSDQFLDRYVFFTDFTYPETSLTIVRRKTGGTFAPVRLECGEVSGFEPLGTSGEYEYAWVRLTSGFVPQTSTDGACGYGRHEATSDGPFSITVWGWAPYASYGYAGGMGSRPVNDAPPPTVQ